MIRKLEAGRREDTNDGGARSAAGGRHCPHMSPPHGAARGQPATRCTLGGDLGNAALQTRCVQVHSANLYYLLCNAAAAPNNCKIRFILEQHSVRSQVAGPGTTINCREGGWKVGTMRGILVLRDNCDVSRYRISVT